MRKLWIIGYICIVLLLVSCTTTIVDSTKLVLPDLTGMTREQIIEKMADYDITYSFYFEKQVIESDNELDQFVRYGNGYNIGDLYPKDKHLSIYTTVLPLTSTLSKTLEMDFEWEGKSFIQDGVGEVRLVYGTDGDTATFEDVITGQTFRLRFLGIDTPEVYAGEDPWGLAASRYTKARLNQAKTIVLEAEGARTETYGRYLGFVWVDGVLLNLEIIEQGYSNSTLSKSKYKDIFMEASIATMKTGRRFFGEIDPEYDYDRRKFK